MNNTQYVGGAFRNGCPSERKISLLMWTSCFLSLDRERVSLANYDAKNDLDDAMVYSDHSLRNGQLFQVKFEPALVGLIVREKSKIPFSYMLYAYSVKGAYRGTKPKESFR